MTIEEYQQSCSALGIHRGALDAGFPDSGITVNKPPLFMPKTIGPLVTPPAQDLTHLNPPIHPNSKLGGRRKKNLKILQPPLC
jgi:hypothetical protein